MKKLFSLLLLWVALCPDLRAQTSLFGQIDSADLAMTSCSFDKGAHAMILFDQAKVTYTKYEHVVMERHKRIKIFDNDATEVANIRIPYWYRGRDERIKNVEANTFNLVNGKIEVTPIDPKLIYTVKVDKEQRAIVFTMPKVKAGSVIEIRYHWETPYGYNYPGWLFQSVIPVRYSEFDASNHFRYMFNILKHTSQKLTLDTTFKSSEGLIRRIFALSNVPSFRLEPYMHSAQDAIQSINYKPLRQMSHWEAVGVGILLDEDFGLQLKVPLDGEAAIVAEAKKIKSRNEQLAYLFNLVKNRVKNSDDDRWYTVDGVKKAWSDKRGNSTEINLILYKLLKQSGVKASLLVLGTRENGEIETLNPGFGRLNKTVVQVPIDSLNFFVMDASGKYNTYNNTPYDLLGINMLTVDPDVRDFKLIKLKTDVKSTETIFVNGSILPTGKLEGSVQTQVSNYKRTDKLETWNELKETKYIETMLKQGNNTLQISNHKFAGMEVDTLPLREDFDFKLELTGSDDNYIYFSPNLFTGLAINPFLSETRLSDIDFIYPVNYSINGRYKVPKGFKIDVLPKSISVLMPDRNISFKRVVGEFEGDIAVNYTISFNKTSYSREEYPDLREFYKRMYEMLSEQLVLKKS